MSRFRQRASGWLKSRLQPLVDWACREELQELREQRGRFVVTLDAVEDLVIFGDADGRLRFANRSAALMLRDLTGRGRHELVGMTPKEMRLPAPLERVVTAAIADVRASQSARTDELAIPLHNGTRWYEQRVSPVFADGRMTSYITVIRDIDERKRAQRRLELLSKMSTLVGNLELDQLLPAIAKLAIPELADWSTVDVRDASTVRRAYVVPRDPHNQPIADAMQQLKPWSSRRARDELLSGRSLFFPAVTDELIRINTMGPEHMALIRAIGVRSAIAVPLRVRGATVAVMTFATTAESGRSYTRDDLTLAEELAARASIVLERARLYEELKASEARFRIALAAARVAVFEQDRELRYRWHYNASLAASAVGKTHADLFPSHEAEALSAVKQRVLDTGESFRGEITLTLLEGPRVLASAIDPVRDDGGEVVGIIGASVDITHERQTLTALEQAVTFREQLMGILGHDLRNPLNAVLAASSLLRRRSDLSPPAREHVERIERAARRMAEMIRTLLDFTRVRFHGDLPVSPAPADLGEVARAIVDELRAAEPERAIELAVHGDARGRWDPARLGEVLSNLVGNALAHGDGAPVQVTIDDAGGDVWLRVHNHGEPIAPDAQAALFEPFRSGAPRDGASRPHGLGLGLYIVRQIVLAHGGAITCESSARDGTTFTVRLPRAFRAAPALSAVTQNANHLR
ncbi:MAG TPA: ATP-binding protein [Polyangia bacterium]|nr:ATP-binding protein [Polyangia bacterium]